MEMIIIGLFAVFLLAYWYYKDREYREIIKIHEEFTEWLKSRRMFR